MRCPNAVISSTHHFPQSLHLGQSSRKALLSASTTLKVRKRLTIVPVRVYTHPFKQSFSYLSRSNSNQEWQTWNWITQKFTKHLFVLAWCQVSINWNQSLPLPTQRGVYAWNDSFSIQFPAQLFMQTHRSLTLTQFRCLPSVNKLWNMFVEPKWVCI